MVPPHVDVEIVEDGGDGFVHTWICSAGRHFDAECLEGVEDHRDLPFFHRHPEAVMHVESGDVDPAWVRNRSRRTLYPD